MYNVFKFSIFSFCLFQSIIMFSQIEKDTIYLKFESNSSSSPAYKGIKFYKNDEKGLVFNLLTKGSLLYSYEKKSDTLPIKFLPDYPIITIKGVEQKVKDFRYKTYGKSPLGENDKAYQFYNKNDIFETFLIEILGNFKFVVYPVSWRNQDIID